MLVRSVPPVEMHPYPLSHSYSRDSGQLLVWDLPQVMGWQEHRQYLNRPPPQIKRQLRPGGSAACVIMWVNSEHLLCSCAGELVLLRNHRTEVWRLPWKPASCLAKLSPTKVIVGSTAGHVAILDWTRVRRDSFGQESRPTVILQWHAHRRVAMPPSGIQHLVVDYCLQEPQLVRFEWITTGGWHLQATADLQEAKASSTTILATTPRVQYVTSDGRPIETENVEYSIPSSMSAVHSARFVCRTSVPPTIRLLPHHDKRVLQVPDSKQMHSAGKKRVTPSLVVQRRRGIDISSVTLSKRRGTPTCLAIHPSGECIVVGTREHGAYILGEARHSVKA